MAYVEGHPKDKLGKSLLGQVGFTLIAGFALIALMLIFSDDWKADLSAVLTIVFVISAVTIFVFYKLNPLGWKKLFNRAEFERDVEQGIKVIERLKELDDSHFIINDFSFELFHVEHLVISENGIFVICIVRENGMLKVENDCLYIGDKSLEILTGRAWRISHLINIIIKNGFKGADIMPQPVLVLPHVSKSAINKYNGIKITGIDEMNSEITGGMKHRIDRHLVENFAYFIKQRYLKNM